MRDYMTYEIVQNFVQFYFFHTISMSRSFQIASLVGKYPNTFQVNSFTRDN